MIFCDECKKKLDHPKDFKNLTFRGNNIIFEVKVIGLASHYCFDCIKKAINVAKPIEEWELKKEGTNVG
jgi:hypothetical protein